MSTEMVVHERHRYFCGTVLKVMRKRAGLSQRQLAKAIGVTSETVMNMETGRVDPRFSHVAKVAEVLGCSVSVFVPMRE